MSEFFNGRTFLIVKAALLAVVVFLVQQDASAEAAKAAGLPVTTLDLPKGLAEGIAVLYGLLQVGQKK